MSNLKTEKIFILNFKQERCLEEETEDWKGFGKNKKLENLINNLVCIAYIDYTSCMKRSKNGWGFTAL